MVPFFRCFVLAVIMAVPAWSARADSAVEGADTFVSTLGDEAIATLTNASMSDSQREAQFRSLLVANFDIPRIGNFVLGRYRREATDTELSEFYGVLEDMLVNTYAGRFGEYSGEGFNVQRVSPDGDTGAIVTSYVESPNGESARVDWRISMRNGSHVVIDVAVEGVSIAQTLREEYASVLQQNGGQVSGLIQALRDRLG